MDIVSQTVAATRAMVADAELQLLGEHGGTTVESHDVVGTDNVAPGDQISLHGEIIPDDVDMHNEAVYTLTLNDHGQPFKTTYC